MKAADVGRRIVESHGGKTGDALAMSILARSDPALAGRYIQGTVDEHGRTGARGDAEMQVDAATGRLTVRDGDRVAAATLLRVPGRDGQGAYMGEVCISGLTDATPLRDDLAESIRDLGDALERHGFDARPTSLPANLIYGDAWAPGVLQAQVEYDPIKDPKVSDACRRFFNLLWANLPGRWHLNKPTMRPEGLEVKCRSPRGLTTAVYDMRILARAAADGHLDRLASASSRMFLTV